MRRVGLIVFQAGIGLAIAAAVLAVLLPWLIRARYLAIGSQNAFWIIGLVIVVCVTLVICFYPPTASSKQRLDD